MAVNVLPDAEQLIEQFRGEPLRALRAIREMDLTREQREQLLADVIGRAPRQSQRAITQLVKRYEGWQPRTDDELHRCIIDECGLRIPRKAVCHGHSAPFTAVADTFFERGSTDKLLIGNRGSGKTMDVAALHATASRYKPQHEGVIVGAILAQAMRGYGYLRDFVTRPGWEAHVKPGNVNVGLTRFLNRAFIAIATATMRGVNSPHPNLVNFDELDLFDRAVFEEGLNMAQSSNGYGAQNVSSSSWKFPSGLVSEIVEGNRVAEREGRALPYDIYQWCVWETTAPCPHDCAQCPFSEIVKGTREVTTEAGITVEVPRTFEWACKRDSPVPGTGKLKYTDGFGALSDTIARFRRSSVRMWESQHESRQPTAEGLVYDCFDHLRHTVRRWELGDEDGSLYGPISIGLDFGGTNPNAAVFVQRLLYDVILDGRIYPAGSDVQFDELYEAEWSPVQFGLEITGKILEWEAAYPGFMTALSDKLGPRIYRDPAAKSAGLELRRMSKYAQHDDPRYIDVHTRTYPVPVDVRVSVMYERISSDRFYIDKDRCPETLREIGLYARNPKTGEPVKEDDHTMDAHGYRMWGVRVESLRPGVSGGPAGAQRARAVTGDADGRRTYDYEKLGTEQQPMQERERPPIAVTPRRTRQLGPGG